MKIAPQSLTVAAVQDSPVFLEKTKTLEKVCQLIDRAASNNASLIVFPEVFLSGYPDWVWLLPPSQKKQINEMYQLMYSSAISINDESVMVIGEKAKEAGVYVAIGANEKNSDSSNASLYNSLLYFNPDGELMGIHRKLIPTGGERLMWAQGQGDSLVSFPTEIGRLGGLICWENFMPLARNAMYTAGVQIYVAPTWDSSEAWQVAMRFIAREGGMFVISCAPCMKKSDIPDTLDFKKLYPEDREWINKGNSCIIDPSGNFLAEPLNSEQSIIYAELDMSLIPSQKWLFDVAGHYARPDVFEFSVK